MKKFFLFLINGLIIFFSFLFVQDLYFGFKDSKSAEALSNKLDVLNPINLDDTENNSTKEENKLTMAEAHNKLKEINNDYKFWLNIENTNIDYPVTQTTDNDFYLNNDFQKIPHKHGSIFVDTYTNFYEDFNTIIYGHNTKAENMLTTLTNYKKEDFFKENNKITIIDKNYIYTFEAVSVYTIRGFDNPAYLYDINSANDKFSKLKELENKSLFSNTNFDNTEKIITLITCSYEQKNTRTVVHAKLINMDEVKNPTP